MHHTFSSIEYKEFLSVNCLEQKNAYDEQFIHLKDFFEDIHSWSLKLSGINHLLCIIIEQYEKKTIQGEIILNYVYNLTEVADFEIQESSIRFIDNLFNNNIVKGLSLEDNLIIAQNKLYE